MQRYWSHESAIWSCGLIGFPLLSGLLMSALMATWVQNEEVHGAAPEGRPLREGANQQVIKSETQM